MLKRCLERRSPGAGVPPVLLGAPSSRLLVGGIGRLRSRGESPVPVAAMPCGRAAGSRC